MNKLLLMLSLRLQNLVNREEGQDLVEYALVVAVIALATIAGMSKIATAINTLFSGISTSLA